MSIGHDVLRDRFGEQRVQEERGSDPRVPARFGLASFLEAREVTRELAVRAHRPVRRDRANAGMGLALVETGLHDVSKAEEPRHVHAGPCADLFAGIDRFVGQRSFPRRFVGAAHRGEQQLVLGAEMPEERHLVHARFFGDPPRGRATETRFFENAQGGIQNSVLGRHRGRLIRRSDGACKRSLAFRDDRRHDPESPYRRHSISGVA